jgi:hypothetical protein
MPRSRARQPVFGRDSESLRWCLWLVVNLAVLLPIAYFVDFLDNERAEIVLFVCGAFANATILGGPWWLPRRCPRCNGKLRKTIAESASSQ